MTIVIPAYNEQAHLAEAVRSATIQPEAEEILIVEDGSTDDTLRIAKQLEQEHPIVRLLRHPGGKNRGPGASRNLGIQEARSEWIAFLDGDDLFLPERFTTAKEKLEKDPTLDGTYGCVEIRFEDRDQQANFSSYGPPDFYTFPTDIDPENLIHTLVGGRNGTFHTAGLTVRRSLLNAVGGFNESLKLSQDFEMWQRLAIAGRLEGASLDTPIARYRVHQGNRSTKSQEQATLWQTKMAAEILTWARRRGEPVKILDLLETQFAGFWNGRFELLTPNQRRPRLLQLQRLTSLVKARPQTLLTTKFWKDVAATLLLAR